MTSLGSLGAAGGYFATFYQGATSVTGGSCVWTRPNGTGYDIGISVRINTPISWSSAKSLNTTYLIVASYNFAAGDTNDVCKIWINPDVSTFGASAPPTETLSSKNTVTDLTGVARVQIRQDAAATTPFIEMDELRIGKSWGDVTPAGPSTGDYRTNVAATSNWSAASSWETFDGTSWLAATTAPTATANVTILSGDTITFDPTSATVATLTVDDGGSLNVTGAKTLNGDVTVKGIFQQTGGAATITMNGNITCTGANAQIKFGSSGGNITNTGTGKIFILANGASFTPATNNGNPPGTANILSMTIVNMTWVIDNSSALTTIIFKNSGNTTILNPPNGQVFGNLRFTTSSGAGPKSISFGADIVILGNLSFDPTCTTGFGGGDATAWTWNLGSYKIRTIGTGRTVTASQLSNHSLIVTGTADTLFPGFAGYNFVPPANGNCLVNYASSAATQTVLGGAYQRLAVSGGSLKTLSGNATVNDTLMLINGNVTTGASVLTVGSAGAVLRTNGYVIGKLAKNIATGAASRTFEIGTPSGYSPATVVFQNVTTAGSLTASAIEGVHPNAVIPANVLKRYWQFVPGGSLAFDNFAATFSYLPGDFNTGVIEATDEATIVVGKYLSGWTFPTIGIRTPGGPADGGSIQVTGVTSFADFAIQKGTTIPTAAAFPEEFDYAAGTLLTANGWTAHSGGGTNSPKIAAPGLVYPGYASSGIGNAASFTTSGEDVSKTWASYPNGITSGSMYYSLLVKLDSARAPGDYFFHFLKNGSTFTTRLFARKAANNNISFGIAKSSTPGNVAYSDSIYTAGTTYLIVAKYSIVSGATNDTVALWINPALNGNEPAPTVFESVADAATIDLDTLYGVAIRQGSATNAAAGTVDGIRVDTTWRGVLGVAAPVSRMIAEIKNAKIRTSVSNTGHIGSLNDYVGGADAGITYNGANRIYEGSFMFATDPQHVSNSVRDGSGNWNQGFNPVTPVGVMKVGSVIQANTMYDDSNMPRPLGIKVLQSVRMDTLAGNDGGFAMGFKVVNTKTTGMLPLWIGGYFDVDMTTGYADRGAIIKDSTNTIPGINNGNPFKIHIAYENATGDANFVGLVPLSQCVFSAARIVINKSEVWGLSWFGDTVKYNLLTTFRPYKTYADSGAAYDHGIAYGFGPIMTSPGDTAFAGVAVVAGSSLQELVNNARGAQKLWVNAGYKMNILTGVDRKTADVPMSYELTQNYPNPFNPSTSIKFALPKAGSVSLKIFDLLGREIRTLINDRMESGYFEYIWNGHDNLGAQVASGVYLYRLESGAFVSTKKMMLLK